MTETTKPKSLTAPALVECGMERIITPAGYDQYSIRSPMGVLLQYESWSYRWIVNGDKLPDAMRPTSPQSVRNLMRILGFKFPKK